MNMKWFQVYTEYDILSNNEVVYDTYELRIKSPYQHLYQDTTKFYEVRQIKIEYQEITKKIYEARHIKNKCQDIIHRINEVQARYLESELQDGILYYEKENSLLYLEALNCYINNLNFKAKFLKYKARCIKSNCRQDIIKQQDISNEEKLFFHNDIKSIDTFLNKSNDTILEQEYITNKNNAIYGLNFNHRNQHKRLGRLPDFSHAVLLAGVSLVAFLYFPRSAYSANRGIQSQQSIPYISQSVDPSSPHDRVSSRRDRSLSAGSMRSTGELLSDTDNVSGTQSFTRRQTNGLMSASRRKQVFQNLRDCCCGSASQSVLEESGPEEVSSYIAPKDTNIKKISKDRSVQVIFIEKTRDNISPYFERLTDKQTEELNTDQYGYGQVVHPFIENYAATVGLFTEGDYYVVPVIALPSNGSEEFAPHLENLTVEDPNTKQTINQKNLKYLQNYANELNLQAQAKLDKYKENNPLPTNEDLEGLKTQAEYRKINIICTNEMKNDKLGFFSMYFDPKNWPGDKKDLVHNVKIEFAVWEQVEPGKNGAVTIQFTPVSNFPYDTRSNVITAIKNQKKNIYQCLNLDEKSEWQEFKGIEQDHMIPFNDSKYLGLSYDKGTTQSTLRSVNRKQNDNMLLGTPNSSLAEDLISSIIFSHNKSRTDYYFDYRNKNKLLPLHKQMPSVVLLMIENHSIYSESTAALEMHCLAKDSRIEITQFIPPNLTELPEDQQSSINDDLEKIGAFSFTSENNKIKYIVELQKYLKAMFSHSTRVADGFVQIQNNRYPITEKMTPTIYKQTALLNLKGVYEYYSILRSAFVLGSNNLEIKCIIERMDLDMDTLFNLGGDIVSQTQRSLDIDVPREIVTAELKTEVQTAEVQSPSSLEGLKDHVKNLHEKVEENGTWENKPSPSGAVFKQIQKLTSGCRRDVQLIDYKANKVHPLQIFKPKV